ncbi:hypothetical protein GCM10022224_069710 [Nonomuraea antimicrobica]|uniref:DUF4386 family protein n=1 Tax=Nonomuraea antimicrobica TaxID=561173 RepID=A0ABP7CPC2_9ACTN
MNPANRLAQLSFTAGPAALLGGWFLMRPIDGDPQPGPWWTSAHVVWLIGFLMLGLMTLAMRGLAGPVRGGRRVAVEAVTGIALFSVAANLTGLVIDLYAGLTAADEDAMRALMTQVKGYPGVELVVYSPGAQLFFGAVLALAVILAALRRVTAVSAAITAGGVVLVGAATLMVGRHTALAAVGMAVMWLGTLLLGRGRTGVVEHDHPVPRLTGRA